MAPLPGRENLDADAEPDTEQLLEPGDGFSRIAVADGGLPTASAPTQFSRRSSTNTAAVGSIPSRSQASR